MAKAIKYKLFSIANKWYIKKEEGEWEEAPLPITEEVAINDIPALIEQHEQEMQKLKKEGKAMMQKEKGKKINKIPYKTKAHHLEEHRVSVSVGGTQYDIYVNGNPKLAQAMNGLTNPEARQRSKVAKAVRAVNRQMSANFNSRNPNFLPRHI